MNLAAFHRKLIYIVIIVVIFVQLYILGQPQTERNGVIVHHGGIIAQLRERHEIGQAHLGQVDPASESMKLATLGLRGIAAAILWHKSNYYRREEYWDRLSATLNQIALIEPHHISVWETQAHNLSYNIAAEFDDYRQRYEWLKKGLSFLIRGTKYNKRQPVLQYDLGRDTGQKIGTADEKLQYRELFRDDEEFHKYLQSQGLDALENEALGYDRKPDHWLVGRLWFNKAYALVESGATHKMAPEHFFSHGPKCLLRYSEAIESEGILDDRAKFAWSRAGEQWREFGNRDLITSYGFAVKLNGLMAALQKVAEEQVKFDSLTSGIRTTLVDERRAKLTELERSAIEMPDSERTNEQRIIAMQKEPFLNPTVSEIAESLPRDKRIKAMELAAQLEEAKGMVSVLDNTRNGVNYIYWEIRADAEQNDVTLAARSQVFNGDRLLDSAELESAVASYESGWKNWAKVFQFYPKLVDDEEADLMVKSIKRYRRALDTELADDFPLAKFLRYKEIEQSMGVGVEELQMLRNGWEQDAQRLRSLGQRLTEADIEHPKKSN